MKDYLEKFSEEIKDFAKFTGFENFNFSIHISLQYKYIYVETPKVACSSIKSILQRIELGSGLYEQMDCFEDIHNRDYSPLLKPIQVNNFKKIIANNGFFKFCFVRNPYSRLLSCYLEKIKQNKNQKRIILAQLGYSPFDIEKEITFEEFVKAVVAQPVQFMDPHWRVQYFQTFQGNFKYDFIGKIENFYKDFKNVMLKINPQYQIFSEEKRHSTNSNSKLGEYFTGELRDMVYAKYKKDFEFFNYNPVISEISPEFPKELKHGSLEEINFGKCKKILLELMNLDNYQLYGLSGFNEYIKHRGIYIKELELLARERYTAMQDAYAELNRAYAELSYLRTGRGSLKNALEKIKQRIVNKCDLRKS